MHFILGVLFAAVVVEVESSCSAGIDVSGYHIKYLGVKANITHGRNRCVAGGGTLLKLYNREMTEKFREYFFLCKSQMGSTGSYRFAFMDGPATGPAQSNDKIGGKQYVGTESSIFTIEHLDIDFNGEQAALEGDSFVWRVCWDDYTAPFTYNGTNREAAKQKSYVSWKGIVRDIYCMYYQPPSACTQATIHIESQFNAPTRFVAEGSVRTVSELAECGDWCKDMPLCSSFNYFKDSKECHIFAISDSDTGNVTHNSNSYYGTMPWPIF